MKQHRGTSAISLIAETVDQNFEVNRWECFASSGDGRRNGGV